ncbi:MAG TPA: hypothetical protein VFM96_05655 [Gaiellaceae bacterium]|nr:hypothetical protein [Gaiellaceae bacterium]
MTTGKWLTVTGLALTLVGAAILSLRDLRGGAPVTVGELNLGFPRREARIGFPLIVVGSALQIIGVVVG